MKRWYQKGTVQGGLVVGALGIVAALIARPPQLASPEPTPRVADEERLTVEPQAPKAAPRLDYKSPDPASGPAAAPAGSAEQEPEGSLETAGDPRTPRRVRETQEANAPPGDLDVVKTLEEGQPLALPSLRTVLAVHFRETLGTRYAEITIAPVGQPVSRFAARSAGGSIVFPVGGGTYQVQVLAVDWSSSAVQIIVRAISSL